MPLITTNVDARGVATLTLNRPDKHNALDGATRAGAARRARRHSPTMREYASSSLTGAGASFCAGADIAHMRSMLGATEQQNVDDALLLARCLRTLDEFDKPVIARVNGNVFGGGVGLVACADIAIGVDDGEVRVDRSAARHRAGRHLAVRRSGDRQSTRTPSVPDRGCRSMHSKRAASVSCTSLRLQSSSTRRSTTQVDHLLRGGPEALRAAKKLVRRVASLERSRSARLRKPLACSRVCASARKARKGLSAFLERRKPRLDDG